MTHFPPGHIVEGLLFEVPALEPHDKVKLTISMVVPFKGSKLIVPHSAAESITVYSLMVGNMEEILDDIPGEMFVTYNHFAFSLPWAEISQIVSLGVKNRSKEKLDPFHIELQGLWAFNIRGCK